ncbi:MAG: hypothetical protein ABR585_11230 [Gemmatimonadaceae bacterium]
MNDEDSTEGKGAIPPNTAHAQYTMTELQQIRDALVADTSATCPRCGVSMTRRGIGGGSFGLGYARQRDWLICPRCRRSAIFDIQRGTRT